MLRTRYIKINTVMLGVGRFHLSALDEHGDPLQQSDWKNLLFSSHAESFYGTFLDFRKMKAQMRLYFKIITLEMDYEGSS